MFQALRSIFVDYVGKLTPLKRFDSQKIKCDKLLWRIGDIDMRTASFGDLTSVVSELIFVSIVSNPQMLLKSSDYRGIAVLKVTSLLTSEPVFAVDTSHISFLDGYSFLDDNEHDASVLDPHQVNCLSLYNQLEFSMLLQNFCKETQRPSSHVLSFVMVEILRLYHPNIISKMLQNTNCFESTIVQSLNMYKEKLSEFESKVRVTASAKKDLVDSKFLFEHIRLPFVGALRLIFSEYLDKSQSQDENYILGLVEVLGGDVNFNVGLLRSNVPLMEECKQGILMLCLLYVFNNLNYTKIGNHTADLHLGQLISMIDGRGEVLKSNRFYRPLFLRSLPSRNQMQNFARNQGPFRGDWFEGKRPRRTSPVSSVPVTKQWSSSVSQAGTSKQGPRSPVSSVTDTDADEDLAVDHKPTREFDQNWGLPGSGLMEVEEDGMTTGDESNPCIDGPKGVATLD
jgi:hypothetical protein